MTNFMFRPAVKEAVGLIIGVIGPTLGGKTYSALRLATGLAGGKKFAAIDTEAGRMLFYADDFNFDHAELNEPFRPESYIEAIKAAQDYPVVVVDSVSHVWAGYGGVLDWHEEELQRMAGDDWKKREACKMAAWIKPKRSHKMMVQKLLQMKSHLILCFRAEEKVKMEKVKGKMEIVPIGFQPVCEKNLPFELSLSFLLTPGKIGEEAGIPKPINLREPHKALVDLTKPLDESTGERLLEWASGGTPKMSINESTKDWYIKLSGKPLNKSQGDKILLLGGNKGLNDDETRKVIDWYCADNKHGGRTYEAGQALIFGWETIYSRFLDNLESQQGG